ncbi:MAG: S41 family peptidase [bacterium]|nr:S41 family peptidase [bacterium]
MTMDSPQRFFIYRGLALVGIAAFVLGWGAGRYQRDNFSSVPPPQLSGIEEGAPGQVDFSLFWQVWSVMDDKFVNGTTTALATPAELQERVYGAISGLVDSAGDPYTVFLPPEEKKSFEDDIRGEFGGVGMELGRKDGDLVVVSALAGSPAKRAGVLPADKIIRVDGVDTHSLSVEEAVKKIRGAVGTKVKLSLFRPSENKTLDLTITRETIQVPTMEAKLLPAGVFLLNLHNFNANSADLFRQGLRQFVESGTDKLIIDLRGNPGGYLDAAVDMASWFLPEGKVVVQEYHGGRPGDKTYRSKGYDIFTDNLKLVILVDKGSASAAEILAGALSEQGLAKLIGEETFGKGSVQELVPLPAGSALKVTIAKWLTPKGHSISDKGLMPDIEVKTTAEDRAASRDPQLERAVKYLLEKKI